MLTYHQAIEIISKTAVGLPREKVPLGQALHRILAEEVFADLDMPPFDKAAVDGYACRKEDLDKPLSVRETVYAGQMTDKPLTEKGECVKIMTGAPVPPGADTVIMLEDTEVAASGQIQFTAKKTKTNICYKGEDVQAGTSLLKPGTLLLPHHLAVLASAGLTTVYVAVLPRVAIVATGSELVEPGIAPDRGQIRNSNSYQLQGQLAAMGISAHYGGILADDERTIRERIRGLLQENEVVIITGGASAGEHDYIPGLMRDMGFDLLFDRLAIQPGKPVSFSVGKSKYCFGLSGNPVSSYLQFELLVKAFLYHLMGHSYTPPIQLVPLAAPLDRKKADRLKFFPVIINAAGQAEEIPFNGSAHIAGLTHADGFGLFPKDCQSLATEEWIEVLRIRG